MVAAVRAAPTPPYRKLDCRITEAVAAATPIWGGRGARFFFSGYPVG